MTDRLQQKAAEIVREQLGYQVPASLESMRVDHPYEYKCALAGLTAGIAMAAEEERELCLEDIQDAIGNWGGPQRVHYGDAMNRCYLVIRNRAKGLDQWGRTLAKGETQHE